MKNILLLTDFSDLSGYARSLADKVAYHTGANLHVLKIVLVSSEIVIDKKGEPIEGMSADLEPIHKEKSDSEIQMRSWVSDLKSNITTSIQYGNLLDVIHDYILNNDIKLVVMGTHGAFGLEGLLSGSVTEHVIKNNSVPVLSLKCDRDNIDFSDFLITGEFDGEKAIENLDILKALQGVFNSTFHLLCVNTSKRFMTTAESMRRMKAFAQANRLERVEYHTYNDKTVEDGIVNFSNNYDASHDLKIDIIAVEKKKKSQLGYTLTGCQATDFVNHVYRPIITYTKG